MGLFNMQPGQGMGQPGQPMPAQFDPMQGQLPSLFSFSTPQAISNPAPAKPKHNWAGIASSFLAGVTGRPDSYMASVEAQRKEAMDAAQAQREQAGKFAQFQQEYDYKAAHPAPINNDTANDYAFWQSKLSPQEFETWKASKYDPPRFMMGPTGIVEMPRQSQAPAPTAPVGQLRPYVQGGPTQPVSGGFR